MAGGVDLRVTGTVELAAFARDLKAAGSPVEMRRKLFRGLNRATKGFRAQLKESAVGRLPAGGGLNVRVASASYTTRMRLNAGNPSVRIRVKDRKGRPVDVASADAGTVRHPTYGHKPTVTQAIQPGWFAEPWEMEADEVRKALLEVIADVARELRG